MANTKQKGPGILKQLMGAVVGGSLALGVYYVYDWGAPQVTAWLSVPQSQESADRGIVADTSLEHRERDQLERKTRDAVARLGATQENPAQLARADVWSKWKEHEASEPEREESREARRERIESLRNSVAQRAGERVADAHERSMYSTESYASGSVEVVRDDGDLPDSGFGLPLAAVSLGAAAGIRRKKKGSTV